MRGRKGLRKACGFRALRRALGARSATRHFSLFHHADSRALLELTKAFPVKAATGRPAIGFVGIPGQIGAITRGSERACMTFATFMFGQMLASLVTKISHQRY